MIRLTLGQMQQWTDATALDCRPDQVVGRLTIDSRHVLPGDVFIALPGEHTDGHAFVESVWKAGAAALVAEGFPLRGGPLLMVKSPLEAVGQMLRRYIADHGVTVVGVTGSVGKTSVKELCRAVVSETSATAFSLGNYNTAIGLPLSFFAGPEDPRYFVAEMGMSALGEIRRLTTIAPPSVAVITTIGPSHLEKLGSMDGIKKAKGEILEGLIPGGVAVLNRDNRWVRELGEALSSHEVRWFGTTEDCDAQVISSRLADNRTEIVLKVDGVLEEISLPWLGIHQGMNVAAAFLVGRSLSMGADTIRRGIEGVSSESSRIRHTVVGTISLLEDIYNASPVSAMAALDVLGAQTGRRVAVLGDMYELGEVEETGHREVGQYASRQADCLIGVGPRMRWAVAEASRLGVEAYGFDTREEAMEWLRNHLVHHDVVLLKASRGMEFERLVEALHTWGGPT